MLSLKFIYQQFSCSELLLLEGWDILYELRTLNLDLEERICLIFQRAMAQRRRVENVRANVQESPDDEQDADQTGQEIKKALSMKGEAVDDLNDLEEDDMFEGWDQ